MPLNVIEFFKKLFKYSPNTKPIQEIPETSLEDELNNKYFKTDINYTRTETDGNYSIDVRDFFMVNDASLPTIVGINDDDRALTCLTWIIKNIKYTPDKTDYGFDEYWAFPYQTLKRKKGDCEDGAILLANLMIKSGIPYYKIRISAGDVDDGKGNKGGHCYVTYYCEEKGYWVLLDWCYWQSLDPINQRKNYKDESYYKSVWFSFNEKFAFAGVKNV